MKNNHPDNQLFNNLFSTMYCIVLFNIYIFASSSTIKNIILKINIMKALKQVSVATILMLVIMQVTNAAVSVPVSDRLNASNEFSGQMVKAILTNGEYLPVVELPTVEIIATRPGSMVVKGIIENGKIMAVVELPAIEIKVSNPLKNYKSDINGYAEIRDIPVIEIVDFYPETNLISATINGEHGMPVVELPEITISVDKLYQKQWLAFVEETSANKSDVHVTYSDVKMIIDQFKSGSNIMTDISMNLNHCLSIDKSTIICEVVAETQMLYASANVNKGILKLIFKN